MNESVERFIEEFEDAIEAGARRSDRKRVVDRAIGQVERLADSLDRLAGSGLVTAAVTSDDLRALIDELSNDQSRPDLAKLAAKASALVTVVEEGIVDGDVARLRAALARAVEVAPSTPRQRGVGRPRMPTPIDMAALEGRTFTHRSKLGERSLNVAGGKWKLDDGTEHASPTAAAKAVLGRNEEGKVPKVNGRKYWRIPS